MECYRLTIPIPKQPWRWIRFRIGTVLLLVAILAMALSWRQDHQKLAAEIHRLRTPYPHYEAAQAIGPPDAETASDSSRTWCPATMNGGKEWLLLEYETAVVPVAILVHENSAPGSIVRITHYPALGKEVTLWQGTYTPTTGPSGSVARMPVPTGVSTNRIKIYLDTSSASGWNEIDAVGLVDANNKVTWASAATASSEWNTSSQAGALSQGYWITR
jgi:hypothetical protein